MGRGVGGGHGEVQGGERACASHVLLRCLRARATGPEQRKVRWMRGSTVLCGEPQLFGGATRKSEKNGSSARRGRWLQSAARREQHRLLELLKEVTPRAVPEVVLVCGVRLRGSPGSPILTA